MTFSPTVVRSRPKGLSAIGTLKNPLEGGALVPCGDDILRQDIFPFTRLQIPITLGASAVSGGRLLYTLPTGLCKLVAAVLDISSCGRLLPSASTGITNTQASVVVGVGTGAISSGAGTGTLSGTTVNIVPSMAIATLVAGVGAATYGNSTFTFMSHGDPVTAGEIYVNVATPKGSATGSDTFVITGSLALTWLLCGAVGQA